MSDRREELLRQREAIRAHLAWLDREIEAAAGAATPPVAAPLEPARPEATPGPAPVAAAPLPAADVEAILSEYRQPTLSIANQTKAGCILYFVLGMALLVFIATAVYVGFKLHRGE